MANAYECISCGNICQPEDVKCPYCGTPTPNANKDRKTITINTPPLPSINIQHNYSKPSSKNNSEINVCLLIFLVIIFWPAAIIYVIVKMSKK